VTSKKFFQDDDPKNNAKKDIDEDKHKLSLKIDNKDIVINDTYRPDKPIKFKFIAKESVLGSGKGEDENAYADGYHVIHPGFPSGTSHKIEVNQKYPGPISVTWNVTIA
jgi:hypothetical protein